MSFAEHTEHLNQVEAIRQLNNLPPNATILNIGRDTDRTTDRYTESQDFAAVDCLNKFGWKVLTYNQRRARRADKAGFRSYAATYFNPNLPEILGEGKLTIVQLGSRDGVKALKFGLGFYRDACSNGMIVGSNVFTPLRLIHKSSIPSQLNDIAVRVVNSAPILYDRIECMSKVQVTQSQAHDIAARAAALRFGEKDKYAVKPVELLYANRYEDNGLTLWRVMNRIQENIIRAPHLNMTSKDGKSRKARELKDIDTVFKINQSLWEICEEYITH